MGNIAVKTKQTVYFCVHCQEFQGWCDCCEPPGCSLSIENRVKLTDAYLEAFKGTRWDKVPICLIPERVIKRMAQQTLKKVMPDAELSFNPPRCVSCEDRAMNGGQHDS